MSEIHTFDVFDTCITRQIAFPSDVFCEVAACLEEVLRPSLGGDFMEVFRATRAQAEVEAYTKTGAEEVSLKCIWQRLARMICLPDPEHAMRLELETESRYLKPNEILRAAIQKIRQSGGRVAFLSDTYLPGAFITGALTKHGFYAPGDGVYVSSEYKATKRSGRLYKIFLEAERVKPAEVFHLGDNRHSDLMVPRSLGIKAELFTGANLRPPEKSILRERVDDGRAAANLAGAMRCFRLKESASSQSGALDFVASFLGPFTFTLAAWVLNQARRDGVERLYFLSRDCYLVWRVAQRIAPFFQIDCRYLQVSRQALFLPSASGISESGMNWMRRPFEEPTLERLLAKLELDLSCAGPTLLKIAGQEGLAHKLREDEWSDFWLAMNEEPVKSALGERIEGRRHEALHYFERQGLLDGTNWGIVDLGWYLSCQSSLKALLSASFSRDVQGYYLGLFPDRRTPRECGPAQALFHAEVGDRRSEVAPPSIFGFLTVLEHVLGIAPHGTVHHYEFHDGISAPVCMPVRQPALDLANLLEELVEEFCDSVGDLAEELGDTRRARYVLDRLTQQCLRQPDPAWVRSLLPVSFSDDQNNLGARPITAPMTWRDLALSCIPWRLRSSDRRRRSSRPWPEASISVSSPAIRAASGVRELARSMSLPILRKAATARHALRAKTAGLVRL